MKVNFFLADAAQAVDAKLFVLGGGWTFTGPDIAPSALVALIEVPWHQANRQLAVRFELQNSDGQPALLGPEAQPLQFDAQIEVGRPPGHPPGTPFNVPMAVNLGPLPLEPGQRYVWVVSVDGETREDWQAAFNVRPRAPGPIGQ